MLKDCLLQTDRLYERVGAILAAASHDGSARSQLAGPLCAITLEHGFSIRALVELDNVTSAIALLRIQFEANVRALWIYYAASDEWVGKVAALIERRSLKEPAARGTDDMLADLDKAAPESVGRMLRGLKDGAWKPLNSYIHSGMHPIAQRHVGYSADYAVQTLRNANGLATMAAMLVGVMSGDRTVTSSIRQVQLDHQGCLPPIVA